MESVASVSSVRIPEPYMVGGSWSSVTSVGGDTSPDRWLGSDSATPRDLASIGPWNLSVAVDERTTTDGYSAATASMGPIDRGREGRQSPIEVRRRRQALCARPGRMGRHRPAHVGR